MSDRDPILKACTLYERVSASGTRYFAGRMAGLSVRIFRDGDATSPDGHPLWNLCFTAAPAETQQRPAYRPAPEPAPRHYEPAPQYEAPRYREPVEVSPRLAETFNQPAPRRAAAKKPSPRKMSRASKDDPKNLMAG